MRTFWLDFTALALLALAVALPVGGFAVSAFARAFDRQARADLTAQAELAALPLRAGAAETEAVHDAARAAGVRFTVIRADGTVAADSEEDPARMENHARRPEVAAALAGRVGEDVRVSATLGERWLYVAVPLTGDAPRVLRAAVSLATLDARVAAWRRWLTGASLAAVAVALAGAWLLARRMARPMERVAQGAERFARGELSHRVTEEGAREFRAVVRSLNAMAGELTRRLDQLERGRHELGAVLGGMGEGVLALSGADEVLRVNPAGARLLGLDAEDARGKPLAALCRHAALLDLLDEAAAEGEAEREIHCPAAAADGGDRWLFAHVTPLPPAARTEARRILVLRDVTRTKRLERVRSDFVHNVSHELRTPVTSTQGYLEMLASGKGTENERRQFLDAALRNARRLGRIIADLLLLADVENEGRAMPREDHALRPILEDAVAAHAALAEERGVTVAVECPESLTARVNAPLLAQAVGNLINNAIRYGPAGGQVTVTAHVPADEKTGDPAPRDGESGGVEADRSGGAVEITVRDEGEGIPAHHASRLFERFYRVDVARSRETGGTGLGLALVRHIVLAHGGRVTVDGSPRGGSAFRIFLR